MVHCPGKASLQGFSFLQKKAKIICLCPKANEWIFNSWLSRLSVYFPKMGQASLGLSWSYANFVS